jgi:biopolymer transport protein ExbD
MSRASLVALVSLVFTTGAAAQGVTRPSFRPPEALQPSTAIVARISATGSLTINNQAIAWGRLATELHAIYGKRPVKLLFLEPHPDAVINDVLRLLDIAKQEGVIVYTLKTGRSIPVD